MGKPIYRYWISLPSSLNPTSDLRSGFCNPINSPCMASPGCWSHILYRIQTLLHNFDGLVQDCSISIALAMEILQSCTKPSICITVMSLMWLVTSNGVTAVLCWATDIYINIFYFQIVFFLSSLVGIRLSIYVKIYCLVFVLMFSVVQDT